MASHSTLSAQSVCFQYINVSNFDNGEAPTKNAKYKKQISDPGNLSERLFKDNVSVSNNHSVNAQSVNVSKKKRVEISAPVDRGQNCKVKGTKVSGHLSASDQETQSGAEDSISGDVQIQILQDLRWGEQATRCGGRTIGSWRQSESSQGKGHCKVK